MDQQMKQDAQALMKVVRQGKVEDQERIRLSTLAFLFGMRAAVGSRQSMMSTRHKEVRA